jgi:hypothetical protein
LTKVVIATPAYGEQVYVTFMLSILNLFSTVPDHPDVQVQFQTLGDSLITRARNRLVKQFLDDPDATHLCFIDADIGFSPDQFWRLLDSGHDVACGIYPFKTLQFPEEPNGLAGRDLELSMMKYVINAKDGTYAIEEDKFTEVLDAATGFMMINRDVLECMQSNYPDLKQEMEEGDSTNYYGFFDCMTENGRPLSEDYAFCRRWQALGGRVMCDVASRLTHVGPRYFRGDFYQSNVVKGLTVAEDLPPPKKVGRKQA